MWKLFGGAIVLILATAPWSFPLGQSTRVILTSDDVFDQEQSKKNREEQLAKQTRLKEEVLADIKPKTWLEKIWFRVRVLVRAASLAILFAPPILLAPIAYIVPPFRNIWFRILHSCIGQAGGCWIKLGQWATTRPDLFPPSLISIFSNFQDQCQPHSFAYTRQVIRENYYMELEELFDEFSTKPIAVGAIAQVYRAKLRHYFADNMDYTNHKKRSGKSRDYSYTHENEVAVKILHPDIASNIQLDLAVLSLGALVLSTLPGAQWLGLSDTVEQFATSMIAQVDLRLEAKNLIRFGENFENHPNVIFPRAIEQLSRKQALVETFEEGESLNTFLTGCKDKNLRNTFADLGLDTYLNMLLVHNFIHADMHPGNLLVAKESKTLILLDVGLVCELSDMDWLHFKSLMTSVVVGDGREAARLMLEHTMKEAQMSAENREHFTTEMALLYGEIRHSRMVDLDLGQFFGRLLDIVRRYQVRHDPNFTTLLVSTTVLEGIGRQLDPSINILDKSMPYLLWSEKANLHDRLTYAKIFFNDWFKHSDSSELPLYDKLYRFFKPVIDSTAVLRSKL